MSPDGQPKRLGAITSPKVSRYPPTSRPRVADQRLFLAAEQKEDDAQATQDAPAWCRQNGHHHRVPEQAAGIGLNGRLKFCEAAGIDQRPQRPNAGEEEPVAGNRLRAVIDQQDKARGQADQTDKAKEETDHGPPIIESFVRRGHPINPRLLFIQPYLSGNLPSLESLRL